MRVAISASDMDAFKYDLRLAHPDFGSCQRLEAAARSLGYNTYAGLRTALAKGPVEVQANDTHYRTLLGLPNETLNGWAVRPLGRALARIEIRKVLDATPNLTCRGFDSIWFDVSNERKLAITERRTLLAERRREAYEHDRSADEFELAWIYLSKQSRIATINRKIGSYGLKHRAEGISRNFDLFKELGNYVSNGMLIAAAYSLGFNVKPISQGSYNAYLNISTRTVRLTYGNDRHQIRDNWPYIQKTYGAVKIV